MKNKNWLEQHFNLPEAVDLPMKPSTIKERVGRPPKNFSSSSARTKRRKIQSLKNNIPSEELIYAVKTVLNEEGRRAAADLVTQATQFSPNRPIRIRKIIKKSTNNAGVISYSVDEALAFLIDTRMTKANYIETRLGAKTRGANIYPVYKQITMAKKRCYPEDININDKGM